ncbi:two-component system sensor histidine kinase NtrB [Natronomonas amylolytica]|uniref:two-component system sensor histidine kinase NtrB n=1 Tax=Natronomonas amylolytica TaxID=3108498 RepID=UPI0030095605
MGDSTSAFADLGQQLFRRAVEASGHSVYFTDRNGIIQYVNPAFEETTGYSAAEAVGRTPRILKSGEHEAAFYGDLWETILSGNVWRNELINERKSGDRYVVDQTIAPVEEDGEITHFVAINVDITDQHEYERRLERQNERLDEFASVVSHDLNNMLTVASGNAELARETGECSYLDRVEEAHDRMEALTDELLTLARSGQTVEDEAPVSLAATARAAWNTTATGDATLVCEHADVEILADDDRLAQILENLFHNAVEHGSTNPPSGTQEDAVEYGSTSPRSQAREDAPEPQPGDLTVRVGIEGDTFYVADDGVGIDPSERQSVFEEGYTTGSDGNGYGLSIVRNIVDAHGWEIDVTESKSGGARFEISGIEFDA